MKHTKHMAIVTLLVLGVGVAAAQSLGDYARTVRKNKPDTATTSKVYDNDNLPTTETLSVVGPAPGDTKSAGAAKPGTVDAATARQQTADAWKDKLDKQKEKIASLSHELDIDQRELQLHAAATQSDPTVSVRNVQFNKDEAQYKSDLDAKQKALDAARQEMDDLQDQAHKAGVAAEKDNDSSKDDKDKQ
jgi:LAS superfamily LD-carboxypeptidase LdcB